MRLVLLALALFCGLLLGASAWAHPALTSAILDPHGNALDVELQLSLGSIGNCT